MKYFGLKIALAKYMEIFENRSNEIHIRRESPVCICENCQNNQMSE